MSIFWVIVVGLFLMIIAIVLDNEIRRNNKQQKIQSSLLELEKKLSNGNISKFTYEDMKKSYLKELKEIEQKAVSPRLKRLEQKKETLTPTPQKTNTKTKTKKPRTKPKETKKK